MDNRGSTLILAIFMIIIFGIIGVSLVDMVVNENIETAEEFQSVQALFLAESGIEIAIFECIQNNICEGTSNTYSIRDTNRSVRVDYISDYTFDSFHHYVVDALGNPSGDVQRKIQIKFRK